MPGLFKRIYVATIIEAGMLAVILYAIPAVGDRRPYYGAFDV